MRISTLANHVYPKIWFKTSARFRMDSRKHLRGTVARVYSEYNLQSLVWRTFQLESRAQKSGEERRVAGYHLLEQNVDDGAAICVRSVCRARVSSHVAACSLPSRFIRLDVPRCGQVKWRGLATGRAHTHTAGRGMGACQRAHDRGRHAHGRGESLQESIVFGADIDVSPPSSCRIEQAAL